MPRVSKSSESSKREIITSFAQNKTALEKILAKYNKNGPEGGVVGFATEMFKSRKLDPDKDIIHTGSILLDNITGCGGIPKGRFTEIYGPEGQGKSWLVYSILANAQQQFPEEIACLVDNENSFDPKHFENLGGDPSRLILADPQSGEDQLAIITDLVDSNLCSIVAVDSVENMTPTAEIEDDGWGNAHWGQKPKLMNEMCRRIMAKIRTPEHRTAYLLVNQVRSRMDAQNARSEEAKESIPGGRGIAFACALRLRIKQQYLEKADQDRLARLWGEGHLMRVKVIKSKFGPRGKVAESYFSYSKGFAQDEEFHTLGIELGVIEVSGSWKRWVSPKGEKITWQSPEDFVQKILKTEHREEYRQEVLTLLYKDEPRIAVIEDSSEGTPESEDGYELDAEDDN
jgi:recombination protein RecA